MSNHQQEESVNNPMQGLESQLTQNNLEYAKLWPEIPLALEGRYVQILGLNFYLLFQYQPRAMI